MLKKAGIVVLGATAGMLSLAPLASAGEAPSRGGDNDHGHHDHDGGHRGGGDCVKFSGSRGDSLVNLSNTLSNADVQDVSVLSRVDDDDNCGGGRGGDSTKIATSEGDSLVNASNLLANADVRDINVLSSID